MSVVDNNKRVMVLHVLRYILKCWKVILGVSMPILLLPLIIPDFTPEGKCGYVLVLMAVYFTFEPIPLAVTALLPVCLFPLLGVLSTEETCYQYMKDTIMMYLGGLIFAAAVEHSNLHKRIALRVLLWIGASPRLIMLGFMITTMFLSMWITNTATTAMMVPIVEAVVSELEEELWAGRKMSKMSISPPPRVSIISISNVIAGEKTEIKSDILSKSVDSFQLESSIEEDKKMLKNLKLSLLLGVAFAANTGGTGTLIGSGPNLVLQGQLYEMFPDCKELTFANWMIYNVPGMLVSVFFTWIIFQLMYLPICKRSNKSSDERVKNVIQKNYNDLGNMAFHEYGVLTLFAILVVLWILREPQFIEGWGSAVNSGVYIKDATPAIGACILLFLIPAKPLQLAKSPPLLDWRTAQRKVPWGVLILLGGGLAVAQGAKVSGLTTWISVELEGLKALSPGSIAIILCLLTAALTEIISNMSMATIMLPVVSQMAVGLELHPLLLMLPVTIACNYAFMLPVGNPSNAIVFDAGNMKMMDMVKPGLVIKIILCGLQLMFINTLGYVVFDLRNFPSWANGTEILLTTGPSIVTSNI